MPTERLHPETQTDFNSLHHLCINDGKKWKWNENEQENENENEIVGTES